MDTFYVNVFDKRIHQLEYYQETFENRQVFQRSHYIGISESSFKVLFNAFQGLTCSENAHVECRRFCTACAGTDNLNFRTQIASCKTKYVSVQKRWI
ncbi:MAG: hypothetical protein ACQEQO_08980 [Thermodesulfobacteriota bacterium]